MNPIHPKKLLHSKWTAVTPVVKEKHFVISEVEYDDDGIVVLCCMEAILSKRSSAISWRDLKNDALWIQGWK